MNARSLCVTAVGSLVAALGIVLALVLATPPAAAAPAGPELRAFVHEACVVADEPWLLPPENDATPDQASRALPLAALVVGKLAEVLVGGAVKATAGRISASAARKDTRYAYARETNLYRVQFDPAPRLDLNASLGCMTLVAARFADGASCREQYQPRTLGPGFRGRPESEWRTTRTDEGLGNVLRRADICVDGQPQSVYEARFEFSPDGTAWRLQNAGYHVAKLLTTPDERGERNVFFTLEVLQPGGASGRGESLTTGIVTLGSVHPGARGEDTGKPSPWLRVPAMSVEARRTYEARTAVHQESWAEIGSLERALQRNERVLAEVRQRRGTTSDATLAQGLGTEEARLAVQRVTLEAELSARRAEYAGLPHVGQDFMPVAIEVGLTESRSEKPALLALAGVIQQNSGLIASTASRLTVSRGVDVAGGAPAATAASDPAALEAARVAWHDARVAARLAGSEAEKAAAAKALERAARDYRAQGLAAGLAAERLP
jgi:hypothetical protein